MEKQGLCIRYFSNKFVLCDGKPEHGIKQEPDEIYIGTIVNWFDTWEDADKMRKLIADLYR